MPAGIVMRQLTSGERIQCSQNEPVRVEDAGLLRGRDLSGWMLLAIAEAGPSSPFSLLVLVASGCGHGHDNESSGQECRRTGKFGILKRNAHVSSVAAFAPVAFILADALVSVETSVLASAAWSLAVTALLALATTLAAGFCGEVRMAIFTHLAWSARSRHDGGLSRLRRERAG